MSYLRTIVRKSVTGAWWEVYAPDPGHIHGRRILAEGVERWGWQARLAAWRARRIFSRLYR